MSNLAYVEHYTYDDYKAWEGDWELIEGAPYAMAPSPLKTHQNLAYTIARILGNALEASGCPQCAVFGEFDYKISHDTILRPDVVFVCGATDERYLTKAPEIVVEVISPATARRDEQYKFGIYEAEKVPYYCLIYPEDLRAKLYKLTGNTYEKVGDFTRETYHFEDMACDITLDFGKVFERFRREGN